MKSKVLRSVIHLLLAILVGAVFVYAGAVKIDDPSDFAQNIKYYKILPLWAVNALALLLPWWEVFCGDRDYRTQLATKCCRHYLCLNLHLYNRRFISLIPGIGY